MLTIICSWCYSKAAQYAFHLNLTTSFKAGVPNLRDLMPGDLRWSWFNNNSNKVDKCNVLESSRNHFPLLGPWKNCLPRSQSLVPKMLGTTALQELAPSFYRDENWGIGKSNVFSKVTELVNGRTGVESRLQNYGQGGLACCNSWGCKESDTTE